MSAQLGKCSVKGRGYVVGSAVHDARAVCLRVDVAEFPSEGQDLPEQALVNCTQSFESEFLRWGLPEQAGPSDAGELVDGRV